MYLNSEGIIFRQTKTASGRRMILLFTAKYGKLSVGTSMTEKGKSRSSLALRPFTYGNYQIFQGRNYYNLDRAETIRSYYGIGEDIDKYMAAAYILELTEKVVPEEAAQPEVFHLLIGFLEELEQRKKQHLTLVLAYEIRLLRLLGTFPELGECAVCGTKQNLTHFSVTRGGMICEKCAEKILSSGDETLIYRTKFDIVNVINYFASNPLKSFRNIALNEEDAAALRSILRSYISYHLDVGDLKSESILTGGLN